MQKKFYLGVVDHDRFLIAYYGPMDNDTGLIERVFTAKQEQRNLQVFGDENAFDREALIRNARIAFPKYLEVSRVI